ncbi:MAG: hypothetical protein MUD16_15300 [Desulfobacterales bacterium]|jgi:hypothetical protein|nr:hypothetical protein [Desulfobacterales bacterium]
MRILRSALLLMMVSAVGCAGSQPVRLQLASGARIGILNVLEPQLTHMHVGALRFDGFTTLHEVDWDIPGYMNRAIENKLKARGSAILVPLAAGAPEAWRQSTASGIIRAANWRIPGDLRTYLEKASLDYRLDAIVSVSSYNSSLQRQEGCFSIGKTDLATQGYGLFTWTRVLSGFSSRVPFGQNTAAPYANIMVAVFQTQPVALAAFGLAPCSQSSLPEFSWWGDTRTLSPAALQQLRPYVEELGAAAAQAGLTSAGLLP